MTYRTEYRVEYRYSGDWHTDGLYPTEAAARAAVSANLAAQEYRITQANRTIARGLINTPRPSESLHDTMKTRLFALTIEDAGDRRLARIDSDRGVALSENRAYAIAGRNPELHTLGLPARRVAIAGLAGELIQTCTRKHPQYNAHVRAELQTTPAIARELLKACIIESDGSDHHWRVTPRARHWIAQAIEADAE